MKLNSDSGLDTFNRILVTPPTERFILWAVSKDPNAFNMSHYLKIAQRPDLMKPNPDSNLAKALTMFTVLIDKGYIKRNFERTEVTFKGKIFRVLTHYSFVPIMTSVGIVLTASALALSISNYKQNNLMPKETKQEQRFVSDTPSKKASSILYKNDTVSVKMIDTLERR